ncbi:TauD/TfdA dioxygenase family protein [Acuticoccus kandeliae]|uniref:TauD/TfdA dioxygenase family protein n=1 Tax=Acuticoccus kandeliae TaxID=2073160 RepID=UPI000D3ED825|nr:TauD/TfdA family dioxygenase [Acuticoccus kandeliae]
MSLVIEDLMPTFGAVVRNANVSGSIAQDEFDQIVEVFHKKHLLVLPTSGVSPTDQVAFSRLFGPLEIHAETRFVDPTHPEIIRIGNYRENGEPKAAFSVGVEQWHADSSYRPLMSVGSLFYGEIVPPEGGDTLFADATTAYEELPAGTKERIKDLFAVHDYEYFDRWLNLVNEGRRPYTDEMRAKFPPHRQPLVRTHPVTGERSLLLCPAVISHLEGLPAEESRLIIDALISFATQDRYVYRHKWTEGDLVIWDNRAVLHTASSFDATRYTRLMRRTTITSELH